MIFTGGTISMKIDVVSHTVKPALSAKQIMLSLLDSNLYNELEVIEYSEVPSPAITPEMMLDISKIIKLHLDNDDAQGFVVVHRFFLAPCYCIRIDPVFAFHLPGRSTVLNFFSKFFPALD